MSYKHPGLASGIELTVNWTLKTYYTISHYFEMSHGSICKYRILSESQQQQQMTEIVNKVLMQA